MKNGTFFLLKKCVIIDGDDVSKSRYAKENAPEPFLFPSRRNTELPKTRAFILFLSNKYTHTIPYCTQDVERGFSRVFFKKVSDRPIGIKRSYLMPHNI